MADILVGRLYLCIYSLFEFYYYNVQVFVVRVRDRRPHVFVGDHTTV